LGKATTDFVVLSCPIFREGYKMILPIMIGVLATILSLLIFKVENLTGIWQRLMFITTFGWMIYEFNK
jgi:hypothetical protein